MLKRYVIGPRLDMEKKKAKCDLIGGWGKGTGKLCKVKAQG